MSAVNLLVFREDRRQIDGEELKQALVAKLEELSRQKPEIPSELLLRALLLAGELECGLADAESGAWRSAALISDRIADALVCGKPISDFQSLTLAARSIAVSEQLTLSKPEGFAYYALHPLAYAAVLGKISAPIRNLVVIGIRTIGATLSAVTAAEARRKGMEVRRFTVRPKGHPYNRYAEFSLSQQALIQNAIFADATFVIVDEGPGLSGSSFLSVAEALKQAGVHNGRIILCSGHEPNVEVLCANDAAQRWNRFRSIAAGGEVQRPKEAVHFMGGGEWRKACLGESTLDKSREWPGTWISFERLKYLSDTNDGQQRLFKFVGLGHYGDQLFEREKKVAETGFGPMPRKESDGFVSYPWMTDAEGRSMSASDLSHRVLERLAEYCAFRQQQFSVELADLNPLQQMAEHNLQELKLKGDLQLRLERPVTADGQIHPHEWLLTRDHTMLKTDSGSHGDDHFFPGPTDIAWDLAGAIVEWKMNAEQADQFLELYQRASGDNARQRIDDFIKAYTVFRIAYCTMAANAMNGSEEQQRLEQAANRYKALFTRDAVRKMSAA